MKTIFYPSQLRLFSEAERLHVFDAVPVVAVDPRQVGFPDLHQLMRTEPSRVRIPLVVEISVSNLQPGELVRYDAAKCGA